MEGHRPKGDAARALEQLQVQFAKTAIAPLISATVSIYHSHISASAISSCLLVIFTGRQDWKAKYLK